MPRVALHDASEHHADMRSPAEEHTMTPEELSALTPEQKRIAIAKLTGWLPERRWRFFYDAERQHGTICIRTRDEAIESRKHNVDYWISCGEDASTVSEIEEYDEWENSPDFLNDLNSMADAEKSLSEHDCRRYEQKLAVIVGNKELGNFSSFKVVTAASKQRADAFLLTKG